jgi:hypothetical protein
MRRCSFGVRFFSLVAGLCTGAVVLCACNGSPATAASPNTLTGTVDGVTFTVGAALAFRDGPGESSSCTNEADGGGMCSQNPGEAVGILLANRSDFSLATFTGVASHTVLEANLDLVGIDLASTSGEITTGTYSVTQGGAGALASFLTYTATCAQGVARPATTGSVTVTQISASSVAGTYDVTFDTHGAFSGTFNVPISPLPDAGSSSSVDAGPPKCEQ